MAPLGDEEIGWFDIPMNKSLCVGGVQSIRNLPQRQTTVGSFKLLI